MSGNRFRKRVSTTALIRNLSAQAPLGAREDLLRALDSRIGAAIDLALDGGLTREEIAAVFRTRAARLDGGRR